MNLVFLTTSQDDVTAHSRISKHVSGCIDTFKLVAKIKKHQGAIADYMDLKMSLKSECQKNNLFFPSF